MDLGKIREQIDLIDQQMLDLFKKRMDLSVGVAEYKKNNNMPIFQEKREQEILKKVKENAPAEIADGAALLFSNIMDISKCIQQEKLSPNTQIVSGELIEEKEKTLKIACPGTKGSNTEIACEKMFSHKELLYFESFDEVFRAVEKGEADYGVVPIENSTAGEVSQTYRLLADYNLFIYKSTSLRINHVLAAKNNVKKENIKSVFSHEQALKQCSEFLKNNPQMTSVPYPNTATAAKMISLQESGDLGAICSPECARLYNLQILDENISDTSDNETRFICISKTMQIINDADIISVSLSLPHTPGALYRMLTRFAYYGLNLSKIESMPVPEKLSKEIKTDTFDVIFYLDFLGNVKNLSVAKLLLNLEQEMKYYKFLGNYKFI